MTHLLIPLSMSITGLFFILKLCLEKSNLLVRSWSSVGRMLALSINPEFDD